MRNSVLIEEVEAAEEVVEEETEVIEVAEEETTTSSEIKAKIDFLCN